jgi:hypothetical protein
MSQLKLIVVIITFVYYDSQVIYLKQKETFSANKSLLSYFILFRNSTAIRVDCQ